MKSLGERMKVYEHAFRTKMPIRVPLIIRIDGKAFHTYTKGAEKPFDEQISFAMMETAVYLAKNVMGCKLTYTQSDEISLLLTNYDKLNTEPWFDNNIQKIVSVTSSLATAKFNEIMRKHYPKKELALFDARAFVLPKEEVNNYFVYRQQDAIKNSISMVAQSRYFHKHLQGLSGEDMKKKLLEESNVDWNELDIWKQRGSCVVKDVVISGTERKHWGINMDIPVFTEDTDFINQYVYIGE